MKTRILRPRFGTRNAARDTTVVGETKVADVSRTRRMLTQTRARLFQRWRRPNLPANDLTAETRNWRRKGRATRVRRSRGCTLTPTIGLCWLPTLAEYSVWIRGRTDSVNSPPAVLVTVVSVRAWLVRPNG